jgi:hypothetical protein
VDTYDALLGDEEVDGVLLANALQFPARHDALPPPPASTSSWRSHSRSPSTMRAGR